MRVVLIGPPGCGKGTQASQVCEAFGVPHIATGDLFREHVAANDDLGQEAKSYMDKGELVPDSVVLAMVGRRLDQGDCEGGFLLDGFPRTVPQAEALQTLLAAHQWQLRAVIDIEVPDQDLIDRLAGRRVCLNCGEPYHVVSRPPKTAGKCDKCDHDLIHRSDDEPGTIRHRLEAYHRQTEPLIGFYRELGLVRPVNGGQAPEAVFATIAAILRGEQ